MTLSDICIRRPVFATVLSLIIVLLGLMAYQRLAVREAEKPAHERVPLVQLLFETAKLWVCAGRLVSPRAWELWHLYRRGRAVGVPPAPTLELVPVHVAEAFETIENQVAAAQRFTQRK